MFPRQWPPSSSTISHPICSNFALMGAQLCRYTGHPWQTAFPDRPGDMEIISAQSWRGPACRAKEPFPGDSAATDGPRTVRHLIARLAAAAALGLSVPGVRAQVTTWTSASSGLWATPGNWSSGVPTGTSTATFNSSAGLQMAITLSPASASGILSFSASGGANAYTFDTAPTQNNNTLTITSGITNSDTAALTFYNTTAVAGTQTWTNNGGAMTFDGNVNLYSGPSSYTLTLNGSGATTIAGVISGGGLTPPAGLTYSGTGTLTLSGANTYAGTTTVSSSIVNIQNNTALGTGAASVASGATLQLQGGLTNVANAITLSGTGAINSHGGASYGALDSLSGNNTVTGAITLGSATQINSDAGTLTLSTGGISGSGKNLTVGGAGNTVISDVIATGAGTLTKAGAGTLTLSGANTFTGATAINGGSLSISADNNLGTAPGSVTAADLVIGGGTLDVTATMALNSNRGITLDSAGATFDVAPSVNLTYGGIIAGSGPMTVTDTGTLTLAGANTYSGITTINSGASLQLGNGTTNGTAASTDHFADSGTLILDENSAVNIGKVISGSGGVTMNGSSNTTLSGTNTYSGATVVNGGTLTAGSASAFGGATGMSTVTLNNNATLALGTFSNTVGSVASSSASTSITIGSGATLTTGWNNTSTTFAGVISGAGSLFAFGTDTFTLTNANTFTGQTTIDGITVLQLGNGTTNGTIASTSGIYDSGNLTLDEATGITISQVIVSACGASGKSAVTVNNSATLALNGYSNTVGSIASSSATSAITLGSATLTTGGNNTSTAFAGVISGTGGITKAGTGTMTLSGANTYSGATTLAGGTVSISADNNLGTAPGTATANMLNLSGGTLATTASFTLNSNRGVTVNSGANSGGTINVASGTTLTYGGLIAGSGTLTLPGAGTLNLTNNNLNFTGSTTVSSGELEFGGTLPSMGTLTLGSGSTLFLNGSDLSVTNLVISGNAIIDFGSSASILNTTNFTVNSGATLTVMDWTNAVDYFYSQNWTGVTLGTRGVGSETHVTFNGFSSANTAWLSYDMEISPAPEPAAYGAILVGISLLGVVVYRRKCSAA